MHVRDWIYVEDHARALLLLAEAGIAGETSLVGGNGERTNLEVVHTICDLIDEMRPDASKAPRRTLINHVTDRPGHDRRYAIDCTKIEKELKWLPQESFDTGLEKTIDWYLQNKAWVQCVQSGEYQQWMAQQYEKR